MNVMNRGMIIQGSVMKAMFSKCITWFEMQEEADRTQVLLLRRVRNFAAIKTQTKRKRNFIMDYFV